MSEQNQISFLYEDRTKENANAALKTIYELHATHCDDGECMTCAVLACPHYEPLHFHHDGCPACAEFSNDVVD